jgi:hypothetical protein
MLKRMGGRRSRHWCGPGSGRPKRPIETNELQDNEFIETFNARPNDRHFNLLFHNCADFARQAIDFYYPRAVRRSLVADAVALLEGARFDPRRIAKAAKSVPEPTATAIELESNRIVLARNGD